MGYDFTVEDVEYLRHGDTPYLARLYRPQGTGPFPMMVELHGGAWCRSDRLADKVIHEALAKSGVIVASLDWRQPPAGAPYPASFQDIHYGIRWMKAKAAELGSRPDMLGSMGNSSGGHQAMLLGMRPFDPRYSALPQPAGSTFDATVRCVILTSPVIDPLGRYRYAKELQAKGQPYPPLVDEVLPCHDAYWQTEAAMDEGAPATALEKGEKVEMPPALYLQGTDDVAHPRPHLDRFVAAYRKLGGQVDLELFEGEGQGFIMRKVGSPASNRALELIVEFVHKQVR